MLKASPPALGEVNMPKLTWSEALDHREAFSKEAYAELVASSRGPDFYFHASLGNDCNDGDEEDGLTYVWIVPIDVDFSQGLPSDSPDLSHILPEYLLRSMEFLWACEEPLEQVHRDMLARGFVESEAFSKNFIPDEP